MPSTMKRSAELGDSTLGDLLEVLHELSNAGVPSNAVLRVRTRASFNKDGALVREVTVAPPRPTD